MKTAHTLFGHARRACALLLGALLVAALFAPALLADDLTDLRRKAKRGDAIAQVQLGWKYATGDGVPQNDRQAADWFRKAAEKGNADAQLSLGVRYSKGQGVPQDDRQAADWFRKAAEQGNAQAQFNLGVMYSGGRGVPQDDRQAVSWWRKAAEQGHAGAQFNLGAMYKDGRGVPQDDRQAVSWWRKAAEKGDANAQDGLGEMYGNGLGVPQDYRQAADWFRKAAEQGLARAQYNLGVCYQNGLGVSKYLREAKAWYRKAAAQGHASAQEALRELESGYDGLGLAGSTASAAMRTDTVEQACVFIVSNGYKPGTGSGFFVAPGYVVTNAHVVAGASDVLVTGQTMRRPSLAQVVATNQSGERDYAVLRIDPADCGNIRPLAFAAAPKRADRVGAWGFPGLITEADPNLYRFLEGDFSAMPAVVYTEGVVSALLERNPTMIVHTAQLSGGSSGGPLVNANGDVVGINTGGKLDDQSYHQASIALSGRDLLQFLRNNGIPAQSR